MIEWIATVRECFSAGRVLYSGHARREMRDEEFGAISEEEVSQAIGTGEAIRDYPDDTPYPSALVFGTTAAGRPLHIVCAHDPAGDQAIIITVYHPHPDHWVDYRRRVR